MFRVIAPSTIFLLYPSVQPFPRKASLEIGPGLSYELSKPGIRSSRKIRVKQMRFVRSLSNASLRFFDKRWNVYGTWRERERGLPCPLVLPVPRVPPRATIRVRKYRRVQRRGTKKKKKKTGTRRGEPERAFPAHVTRNDEQNGGRKK